MSVKKGIGEDVKTTFWAAAAAEAALATLRAEVAGDAPRGVRDVRRARLVRADLGVAAGSVGARPRGEARG